MATKPDRYSIFDYTLTLTRKHRYLVVGCAELGFQIAPDCVELRELSPERIGEAVLRVLTRLDERLQSLERDGRAAPKPFNRLRLLSREMVPAGYAAQVLGVSRATLRRMAYSGALRAERTPGGHLRVSLEALSQYLSRSQAATDPTAASA